MKKLLQNKTTIVGILTILWVIFSGVAVTQGWLDAEQVTAVGTALVALGLISAKDANKHSTSDQVAKADEQKSIGNKS